MKIVDLGLLSGCLGLGVSFAGVLLVLIDVPVPDRWPHAREPQPRPAPRRTVEADVERLEQRVEEVKRQRQAVYEASQPTAACRQLTALYLAYEWDEADALAADLLTSSRCWLRLDDLRMEARLRRLEQKVADQRAARR